MSNDKPSDELRPGQDSEFEEFPEVPQDRAESESAPVLDEEFVLELDDVHEDWFLGDGDGVAADPEGASAEVVEDGVPELPVLEALPEDEADGENGEVAQALDEGEGEDAAEEAAEEAIPSLEALMAAEDLLAEEGLLAEAAAAEDPEVPAAEDDRPEGEEGEGFDHLAALTREVELRQGAELEAMSERAAAGEDQNDDEDYYDEADDGLSGDETMVAGPLQELTDLEAFMQDPAAQSADPVSPQEDEDFAAEDAGSIPESSLPEEEADGLTDPSILAESLLGSFDEEAGWTEQLSGLTESGEGAQDENPGFFAGPEDSYVEPEEDETALVSTTALDVDAHAAALDAEQLALEAEEALLRAEGAPAIAVVPRHRNRRRFIAAAVVVVGLGGLSYFTLQPVEKARNVTEIASRTPVAVGPATAGGVDTEGAVAVDPTPVDTPVDASSAAMVEETPDSPPPSDPIPDPVPVPPSLVVEAAAPPPVILDEPIPDEYESIVTPERPAIRVAPGIAVIEPGISGIGATARESDTVELVDAAGHRQLIARGEIFVELENGHIFQGRVKRVRGTKLTLAQPRAEFTFDMSRLAVLEGSASAVQNVSAREALVVLKNGQRIRGHLVQNSSDLVQIRFETGTLGLPRSDVASISFVGRVHF